jgi:predicted phage-related endonuclease
VSELQLFDCEQGSPSWFDCRRGIPTASEFGAVLAKGEGKTRRTYLFKLAGEVLTGECVESYSNDHMERGKVMEDDARSAYAFMCDQDPQRIGFMRRDAIGASPDSVVVPDKGLLEIKTKLPHLQIDVLERDDMPPEHKPQVQGQLLVSGYEFVDFVSYWPRLPLFVKRVYRDEAYLKTLQAELDRFNDDLAALVERIRAKGAPALKAAA